MTDKTISLRIDSEVYRKMKILEHINWSALLRKTLVKELSKMDVFDREKIKKASEKIDKIRISAVFDKGKSSTQIIREWRNKH